MLGRLLAAALLAVSVLGLAACEIVTGILSWSMFPSFLSGVEATRNLTQELKDLVPEGSTDWGTEIAALRSPTTQKDYVFLAVHTPRGNRLLVLNADLEIINTVNNQPIDARALVDAGGRFVIGAVQLADPPVGTPLRTDLPDGWFPFGFSVNGASNYSFRQLDSNRLQYSRYDPSWTGGAFPQPVIDGAVPAADWNLAGVGYVDARAAQEVMIATWSWDKRLLAVVFLDQAVFSGAYGGPLVNTTDPPTILAGPGFFVSNDENDPKRVHYTAKGVLVRNHDREARLYDFAGSERLVIHFGEDEVDDCYTADGQRFFYFNRDQRVLFKGRTGW